MIVAVATSLALLLLGPVANAQNLDHPVRIGVLTAAWGPPAHLEGLVAGLAELGHRENDDFVIALRFTEGDVAALPAVAEAMVTAGVDVLVTVGPLAADAARAATSEIPIVFIRVGDPIGQGLIDSFASPGGNVTGIVDFGAEASRRRLQLFTELVPGMNRILFPYNAANTYQEAEIEEYRLAAARLGIHAIAQPLRTADEAASFMTAIRPGDHDGIIAPRDVDLNIPGLVLEAAQRAALPSMFDLTHYPEMGALASYGGPSEVFGRQAARMVDKIMRGTDVGAIPTETVASFEFVVNLARAAELGIDIPAVVLYQADRILR